MIDVINNYFLSRKLEDSIIPRNREIIAKSNLETLKIGLIVSFVVFSGAGIYYLFCNPMRSIPDFVFSVSLVVIYFLVRKLKNPSIVLICLYSVSEYFCLFTMSLSFVQPNMLAVVGVCILCVLPSEILDRSQRVEFFSLFNTILMSIVSLCVKDPFFGLKDSIHFLGAFLIGVAVGAHTRVGHLQQFELQRKTESQRIIDFLTGLMNRRKLFDDLSIMRKENKMIAFAVMIDVDFFKEFNDTYGHQSGDLILQKIGNVLSEEAGRNGIVFYRYGGEEFIGIGTCSQINVPSVCESVRMQIEDLNIKFEESPFSKVTVSIGYATNENNRFNQDELIRMTDSALYHAKRAGRNRTVAWEGEFEFLKDLALRLDDELIV